MPSKYVQTHASIIYKPEQRVEDFPNQKTFHHNFSQDYMHKQQIGQEKLTELILQLQQTSNKNEDTQNKRLDTMNHKLLKQENLSTDLLNSISDQRASSLSFHEKLEALEVLLKQNTQAVANEAIINQAILDQVSYQELTVATATNKLDDFVQIANQMQKQLEKAEDNYHEVSEKLELQEIFHQIILEKMDENEANINKISRQLDTLKSILFERFNFLVEKWETNFKSLSEPVQRFFLQKK
ncbi:hypothetical protein [Niallia sp. 03133]|uniref:hypothetical protein n=1 Tax=Niallia sp. 03133 TaxID=3458060 RepID=UPI004044B185